jgi:hypothetical protein
MDSPLAADVFVKLCLGAQDLIDQNGRLKKKREQGSAEKSSPGDGWDSYGGSLCVRSDTGHE